MKDLNYFFKNVMAVTFFPIYWLTVRRVNMILDWMWKCINSSHSQKNWFSIHQNELLKLRIGRKPAIIKYVKQHKYI